MCLCSVTVRGLCSRQAVVVTLFVFLASRRCCPVEPLEVCFSLGLLTFFVGWLRADVKRQITIDTPHSQVVWGSYTAGQASLDYSIF